jgi:hypothetical protein
MPAFPASDRETVTGEPCLCFRRIHPFNVIHSIVILSSVEILCSECFSLSSISFEIPSKLKRIDPHPFDAIFCSSHFTFLCPSLYNSHDCHADPSEGPSLNPECDSRAPRMACAELQKEGKEPHLYLLNDSASISLG